MSMLAGELVLPWQHQQLCCGAHKSKGPLLAVGDGAMGFWAALEEVFPATRGQRCWFHYSDIGIGFTRWATCLTRCGNRNRAREADLQALKKDCDSMLAFYDFPAEHWQHLRTANAIELTFATVRHRTTPTRNCVSRPTVLGLAFKLIEEAEKTGAASRPRTDQAVAGGIAFRDGEPVQDDRPAQQKLAA